MESSGPLVVPSQTSQKLTHSCKQMDLQVVAKMPGHFSKFFSQTFASGSLRLKYKILDSTLSGNDWHYLDVYSDLIVLHVKNVSLQHTLDAAASGSTVIVPSGRYFDYLHVTKPVKLISASGANVTIIHGHIVIAAVNVSIEGLSICPLTPTQEAVLVERSQFVSIHNCRVIGQREFKYTNTTISPVPGVFINKSSDISFINNLVSDLQVGVSCSESLRVKVQTSVFSSCLTAVRFNLSKVEMARSHFVGNLLVAEQHCAGVFECRERSHDLRETVFSRKNIFERNVAIADLRNPLFLDIQTSQSIESLSLVNHTYLRPVSVAVITGVCSDSVSHGSQNNQGCVYIQSECCPQLS